MQRTYVPIYTQKLLDEYNMFISVSRSTSPSRLCWDFDRQGRLCGSRMEYIIIWVYSAYVSIGRTHKYI